MHVELIFAMRLYASVTRHVLDEKKESKEKKTGIYRRQKKDEELDVEEEDEEEVEFSFKKFRPLHFFLYLRFLTETVPTTHFCKR